MKKTVNIVALVLACLVLLYIVFQILIPMVGGLIIGGVFNPPIGKDKMEKIFYEDCEDLILVRDHLINLEEGNVYYRNEDDLESGGVKGTVLLTPLM